MASSSSMLGELADEQPLQCGIDLALRHGASVEECAGDDAAERGSRTDAPSLDLFTRIGMALEFAQLVERINAPSGQSKR